eukprot:g13777.t1
MKKRGAQSSAFDPQRRCWKDLNVWLIEINSSPDLSYSTSTTKELVKSMIEDMMAVVVDVEKFGSRLERPKRKWGSCRLKSGRFQLLDPARKLGLDGLSCELGPFPPDSAVAELRSGAEKALGRPVRLIGPDGLLEEHLSLQSAKLHDHDTVGAIADWPKMASTSRAFVLWCGGGVVTWGPARYGGDCSKVQALLETTQIQHVQSSDRAFAAILADGTVCCWGDGNFGGDSCSVQEQLVNVKQIKACNTCFGSSFAADGAVVTWGHERAGLGDPNYGIERPKLLEPVEELQSVDGFNGGAFAARSANGAVSTWGDCKRGGDSRGVQEQLRQVRQLQASRNAFAAITEPDGRVVTWGLQEGGGDSTAVQDQLHHVEKIQVSCGFAGDAFAAIRSDGRVVTWGWAESGGDSSRVEGRLREVQELQATSGAFCALRADGRVVTWGRPLYGGHVPPEVSEQLREVQEIQASSGAFAALRRNGVVVAWGDPSFGGDCSEVQEQLTQARMKRMRWLRPEHSRPNFNGDVQQWQSFCTRGFSAWWMGHWRSTTEVSVESLEVERMWRRRIRRCPFVRRRREEKFPKLRKDAQYLAVQGTGLKLRKPKKGECPRGPEAEEDPRWSASALLAELEEDDGAEAPQVLEANEEDEESEDD